MKFLQLLVVVMFGLVAASCDGPTAGEFAIDLVTPSSNDGAILFKVEALASEDLGGVTATCSGCQAYTYKVSETELFCAVTGPLSPGPLVRMAVSHVGVTSAYSVEILEVTGTDRQPRSTEGYELRLSR